MIKNWQKCFLSFQTWWGKLKEEMNKFDDAKLPEKEKAAEEWTLRS